MKELENLQHVTVPIAGNPTGEVIVLDTGATIDAEAEAMLQALHSRSVGGLREHLASLAERGAENFMAQFYVGYGHASIGDCGGTVIFIEGVSMLAAKAIQDWRLYSGQEASTRYIDFAHQAFLNPLKSPEGETILENWRHFYTHALPLVIEDLKERFPLVEGESASVYEKAIKARAFDTLRGFLPAGSTTNLAWSSNLRQVADALKYLRHHPLPEVRQIAQALGEALAQAHPNSFAHKHYEATEAYNQEWMSTHYYYHDPECQEFTLTYQGLDLSLLSAHREAMQTRPPQTELPRQIAECGTLGFSFPLDFGSFRDLQRHRAIIQRMPLLTPDLGFNSWYLDELPPTLQDQAETLLESQEDLIATLHPEPAVRQYYLAMGYNTANRLSGDLAALTYVVELRATRFVHPTLRHVAQEMAGKLMDLFGEHGLVIHLDKEADRFDVKRGEHDLHLT